MVSGRSCSNAIKYTATFAHSFPPPKCHSLTVKDSARQKRPILSSEMMREARPKRGQSASLQLGARVVARGTQDGLATEFCGTIVQVCHADRFKVVFDDGDANILSGSQLRIVPLPELLPEPLLELLPEPLPEPLLGSPDVPPEKKMKLDSMTEYPAVKTEAKTEAKPEAKPEVKQEAKPEAMPEYKPMSDGLKMKIEEVENARSAAAGGKLTAMTIEQRKKRDVFLRDASGRPRKVFTKGNTGIHLVLGGNGMEPWPIVKNPRPQGFVKQDEFYFAGARSFNPWAPAFAGDELGFIELKAIPDGQTEFHVFGQCCSLTEDPFRPCHGEAAAGKFIYCGVYELKPDEPAETMSFRQMKGVGQAQWSRVEWLMLHPNRIGIPGHWNQRDGEVSTFRSQEHLLKHLREHGYYREADKDDGEGVDRTALECDHFALLRYLEDENPLYWRQRVQFKRYDENLYAALVAERRCVAKDKHGNDITIETNVEKLGYV